jgi:two-component system NtrC family sensor kinase
VSLQRALVLVIAMVLLAALLPAGLLLERRLAGTIEAQTRRDLALAPTLLAESRAQSADAMMMHAKDLAAAAGLADALMGGNDDMATRIVESARAGYGEQAVLLASDGRVLTGTAPPAALVERAMQGEMPVEIVPAADTLRTVALAPVQADSALAGVAGVITLFDADAARVLAGLTRADVVIVVDGSIAATTADTADARVVAATASEWAAGDTTIHTIGPEGRLLARAASLGDYATAVLVRDLSRDRAVVGELRRIALASIGVTALLGLLFGGLFAMRLAQPVGSLANAADRLAAGDFHAPLKRHRIAELARMADAFDAMRTALASRIDELARANRELADRQQRLSALQAELIQRDRLASAGQLVAQLAHEIRNPVANVRNCLEVIRRRTAEDDDSREFVDMAIDELLRMHELAEQMLDLHRPRDTSVQRADAASIAREVVSLVGVGAPDTLHIELDTGPDGVARIAPDALKQLLLNVVQNAREAVRDEGRIDVRVDNGGDDIVIDVTDSGPGIPSDVLPHVFDPFFTTKGGVRGVGLGLFVAEGIVRGVGGHMKAANVNGGARFTITLPAVEPAG